MTHTRPVPPADLAARDPEVIVIPARSPLHRFHNAAYGPVHFDRSTSGRLNAPDGSYGVLYVARDVQGAFAETFLRTPGLRNLSEDRVRARSYAVLGAERNLRLVKLMGPGLARLGATAEVTHGSLPYDLPQVWSKALEAHPVHVDGIAYTARHDDEQVCYALFDRCQSEISPLLQVRNIDEDWFWEIAEIYDLGFEPGV